MGDTEVRMKSKKTVFVTVGTTSFDALVNAVDTREVKEELWRRGYTEILIQMGRGSYIPSKVFSFSYFEILVLLQELYDEVFTKLKA